MGHSLGINWLCYHKERADFDHIAAMGYKSIKVFEWMWNNKDFCNDLLAATPQDTIFIARDVPLSHQHDFVRKDPLGAGKDHALQWAEKVRSGNFHLPLERTFFQGVNEFDENGFEAGFNTYTEAYIVELYRLFGAKAAAYVLGTGHPSTINRLPNTNPDWKWYASSAHALIEHDGIACLHEYGAADNLLAGFHIGRSAYCPYPMTVVYDEFGIDYGVIQHGNLLGYLAFVGEGKPFREPSDYVPWIDNAIQVQANMLRKLASPLKVHSHQLFTYDTDNNWKTFDIRPIRQALQSFSWTPVSVPSPLPKPPPAPYKVNLPFVSNPPVTPSGDDAEENWKLAIDFVLGQEGGYVNDPKDPGGETKWGISKRAHPHLDIKSLSREQAIAIYRKEYWEESGANQLPWPMCLVHFDSYVQNKNAAIKFMRQSSNNPYKYLSDRIRWYTFIEEWDDFGKGWMRRMADLVEVVGMEEREIE